MSKKNEEAIYKDKTMSKERLVDVGLRFNRSSAEMLAGGWRQPMVSVRIHPRRIKVDGISFPVFMVVAREAKGLREE